MQKNLNPLYEMKTPLVGKTGSVTRKVSSKLRGFVKSKTEPGNIRGGKHIVAQYPDKPKLSRNQKAKILKDMRKESNIGKKMDKALGERMRKVVDYAWKKNIES